MNLNQLPYKTIRINLNQKLKQYIKQAEEVEDSPGRRWKRRRWQEEEEEEEGKSSSKNTCGGGAKVCR